MVECSIRRAGACFFDITLKSTDDKEVEKAALILDTLLSNDANKEWLMAVHPWANSVVQQEPSPLQGDRLYISYRGFSGLVKESQALLKQWINGCQKVLGKKFSVIEGV